MWWNVKNFVDVVVAVMLCFLPLRIISLLLSGWILWSDSGSWIVNGLCIWLPAWFYEKESWTMNVSRKLKFALCLGLWFPRKTWLNQEMKRAFPSKHACAFASSLNLIRCLCINSPLPLIMNFKKLQRWQYTRDKVTTQLVVRWCFDITYSRLKWYRNNSKFFDLVNFIMLD